MILEIPIDAISTDTRQVSSLDGAPYLIDLSWSDRTESWYISVFIQQEAQKIAPVVQGIRLAIGYPVLAGVVGDERPPGEIISWDVSGVGEDAGRNDLGTRVRLYYYDADEMDRIRA